MNELKGKKVLVVGLGFSGVAAVKYCVNSGASVTATDLKPKSQLGEAMAEIGNLPVTFSLGGHTPELFGSQDVVVTSPGVPSSLPGLMDARTKGIPVIGELELALREIGRPVVAVTGTNGKTTTTMLTGHLLQGAGIRACVAGNIGTPLLGVLDDARKASFVVLEVSSFQIETTPSLTPHIAILLNITPDHLDRHSTFGDYVACKARIIKSVSPKGFAIYNAADEGVARAVSGAGARLIPFDATGRVLNGKGVGPQAWFSSGDLCVRLFDEWLNSFPLSRVKLEGIHNRENMLAALAAALLCGASADRIARSLESFKGLPHRLEFVGECNGVRYYDDSKGTNVGATIRALEGFAEPVVLIAGGLSKGADFAPLIPYVRGRVKGIVLIGEAAAELEMVLRGATKISHATTMDDAVRVASQIATPGDVVLLSPACASFDMFRDYKDRGEAFVRAVFKCLSV